MFVTPIGTKIDISKLEKYNVIIKSKNEANLSFEGVSYFSPIGGYTYICENPEIFNKFEVGKEYAVSNLSCTEKTIDVTSKTTIEIFHRTEKYHFIEELTIPKEYELEFTIYDKIAHLNYSNFEDTKQFIHNNVPVHGKSFTVSCLISFIFSILDNRPYFGDLFFEILKPYTESNHFPPRLQHQIKNQNIFSDGLLILLQKLSDNGIIEKKEYFKRVNSMIKKSYEEGTPEFFCARNLLSNLKQVPKTNLNKNLISIACMTASDECFDFLKSQGLKINDFEKEAAIGGSLHIIEQIITEKSNCQAYIISSHKKEAINWLTKKNLANSPFFKYPCLSVSKNSPYTLLFLLENGGHPDDIAMGFNEPLTQSITDFKTLLSAILLDHGASLQPICSNLMQAVTTGDPLLIHKFIQRGAKINQFLLSVAIQWMDLSFIQQYIDKETPKEEIDFFAFDAIKSNQRDKVEYFISLGLEPEKPLASFGIPLSISVEKYPITFCVLLEQMKTLPKNSNRFLTILSSRGDIESIRKIIKLGADPNATGHLNQTPLIAAIQSNQPKAVEELIKLGADPNASEPTPLMMAIHKGTLNIIEILLKNGADPMKISKTSAFGAKRSPLEQAEKDNKQNIVDLIKTFIK